MNINSFEVYPYVRVYTNLMDDNQNLYNTLQNLTSDFNKNVSFVKSDWITENKGKKFGDYLFAQEDPNNFYEPFVFGSSIKNFGHLTKTKLLNTNYLKEFHLFKRIQEIKKLTIEDYVKIYNVNLPKKTFISLGVNIARYEPNFSINEIHEFEKDMYFPFENLSMVYHTDYTGSNDIDRENQFLITSNIYFNDDYEGGSIIFYVEGDKFSYKPKAGEILVFPSGSPLFLPDNKKYLHAVETNKVKEKFLSRNYLMYSL